eukprot:m.84950 g.84950  ORF g.84950 m.84950 type:complete len:124 (+) comp12176_c1_seq2:67-438(+)
MRLSLAAISSTFIIAIADRLQRDVLMNRLNALMSLEIGTVINLHTIAREFKEEDSLVLSGDPDNVNDSEAHRVYLACMTDPVFTVIMREQFTTTVNFLREQCGDEVFQALDEAIAQQIQDLLL